MEFKVLKKEIGALAINYEELKQELSKAVKLYDGLKVVESIPDGCSILHTTEDGLTIYLNSNNDKIVSFSDAKGIRARLNKVSDVINKRKTELKKEFLRPYENVEAQAKELMKIIDLTNTEIDKQVKAAEEQAKKEKLQQIVDLWDEKNYNTIGISFSHVLDPRWTNKCVSMAKIEEEMADKYLQFKNDLESIDKLVSDKNKALLLKTKYCLNPNLSKIISDYNAENEKAKELIQNEKLTKDVPDCDVDVNEEELDLEHPNQELKVIICVDEFELNDLMKYCSDKNLRVIEVIDITKGEE